MCAKRCTFIVQGIGKLVLSERPARKMVMRFGIKAGQTINVPKKKVVKFRLAKAAKDTILAKEAWKRVLAAAAKKPAMPSPPSTGSLANCTG